MSLKSSFALFIAGRGSESSTRVGFPCGLTTYCPRMVTKPFFVSSFSRSEMVLSSRGRR
jgi:hypothetical protein